MKPDWNDHTELLGYKNINNRFVPGKLTLVMQEALRPENRDKTYFVCLDEMNLARVEYYLSDYLSVIESREFTGDNRIETSRLFAQGYLSDEDLAYDITIPDNVYVIGTANMDDTTFAFSKKVLDRANTIEFADADLENLSFTESVVAQMSGSNNLLLTSYLTIKEALAMNETYVRAVNEKIVGINHILAQGNRSFGYRVRDEIVFYMLENERSHLLEDYEAFDFQMMQKILPAIMGSEGVIKEILIDLFNYCSPNGQITDGVGYLDHAKAYLEEALYPKSAKKILMMLRGYEDGFTSFWG